MKTMKTKISSLTPLALGALIGALSFLADTRVGLAIGLGNGGIGIVRRILDRYGFPINTAFKMESAYTPRAAGNNELNNLHERVA